MLKFTAGTLTGLVGYYLIDSWCRKQLVKNSPAMKDNPNMQALLDTYKRTGTLDKNSPEFREELARIRAAFYLNEN